MGKKHETYQMHSGRTPQIVEDLYCEVCEESLNYLTVCIWNRNKNLQVIINLGENMLNSFSN
jgi:hypothetical protein